MSAGDPTRREFLMDLARRASYTAPALTTFAVMPAILQGSSSQHKKQMAPPAIPSTSEQGTGRERPSELHPPPSSKKKG